MPGLSIRPAAPGDAEAIAQVHVESWRTTYTGLLPEAYLDSLSPAAQQDRWEAILAGSRGPSLVYVAEREGDVVGFASGGREREDDPRHTGELYAIYLLAGRQRLGLGRRLVSAVARGLAEAGHRSMLVWVLSENRPARNFYESLGGAYLRQAPHDVGGLEVEEVSYGWLDLRPLMTAAAH